MEPNQQVPPSNMGAPMSPPPQGAGSNTGMAILAYLFILVVIPLATNKNNDPFIKFHAKQGLVLLIAGVIGMVFSAVPIIGWIASPIIGIGLFILMIMGIINAAGGQMKELPLIGHFASKFNF